MKGVRWFAVAAGWLVLAAAAMAQVATQEVSIIAKQFEYYPNQIVVRANQPVRLYLTSVDVDHGFALSGYNINKSIAAGKITVIDFVPDKAGTFDFHCSVFCGLGHLGMKGKLYVVQ